MKWDIIKLHAGREAVAPEIISASRATDIPAFYSPWFFNRLKAGYVEWQNPFNGQKQLVSFAKTRLIVFWSKNPAPILPYLRILDEMNINYYFQFTLNNYDSESYEPNLPALEKRIATFHKLSETIGKGKVIWRFDPILITDEISKELVIDRISNIANKLHNYTNRLVFSFADIDKYKKVKRNLLSKKINYKNLNTKDKIQFVKPLAEICKNLKIELRTCAQKESYDEFNIFPNKCLDDEIISQNFSDDEVLMNFLYGKSFKQTMFPQLRKSLNDSGQRKHCRCIRSKDIGCYNTCPHLCCYCYANSNDQLVVKNFEKHNLKSQSIIQT